MLEFCCGLVTGAAVIVAWYKLLDWWSLRRLILEEERDKLKALKEE